MEKSRMNLPKGPDTLCFDKDEFMKVRPGGCAPRAEAGGLSSFPSEASSSCWARTPGINPRRDLAAFAEDFDVDHFVSDCPKQVQLEALRDDLELYYKLKTAMVELINKDYADFVNLSTNLVSMDKALNQLSAPLGQLGEEVLAAVYPGAPSNPECALSVAPFHPLSSSDCSPPPSASTGSPSQTRVPSPAPDFPSV
ncbi:conserved oligomeric Golgi complex subunit 2-like isoform X3 [Cervus elaphus]|uniref:conserved oligomeric Golgi complex subunit 2-like isoform X3 n=1 Tax=Cervus elaphus TaxID=9860 RepID=UPI001CC27576|nr:conserved oligomeric Golgi complex subunit 2-like isoform X3 [Cervus elaphus]